MISQRGVTRDAGWLVGGEVAALAVTFVATPLELHRMGSERYGIVVVLSALIGYLAVLDGGVGWALARYVPWYRARHDEVRVLALVIAGLIQALAIGVVFGVLLWAFAAQIVDVVHLSGHNRTDAHTALELMAVLLPVSLIAAVLSGLGQGLVIFRFLSVAAAANVIVLNVVWVIVAGHRHDVVVVAATQLVLGVATALASLIAVRATAPAIIGGARPRRRAFRELARFGALSSVTEAGMRSLTQADKAVLGSIIPVAAVPAYSIPFSVAFQITLFSRSVISAVYPRLTAALSRSDAAEARRLSVASSGAVGVASGILLVCCVFAGKPFLRLWVGSHFASHAWRPLAVLGIGFAVFACGSVGIDVLNAAGRVGVTAVLGVIGGVVGLGAAAFAAATWESPFAASIGIAAGLCVIGLGGVELSRRLVVGGRIREAMAQAFSSWVPLTAAGAATAAAAWALSAGPLIHTIAVGLTSAEVGRRLYARTQATRRVGRTESIN
jgi:O-antigen/teichoic acid export membrane protein